MSEHATRTEHTSMSGDLEVAVERRGEAEFEPDDDWPPIGHLLANVGEELVLLDSPLNWSAMAAEDAASAWRELRDWVTRLIERFELDFRTVPACWFRHNALVEALIALRDHERACYGATASLGAGLEWHRALRDIEARLREWTSRTGCLARHVPRRELRLAVTEEEWSSFIEADVATRRHRFVAAALSDDRC